MLKYFSCCWWFRNPIPNHLGCKKTAVNSGISTTNLNWWVCQISGCHQHLARLWAAHKLSLTFMAPGTSPAWGVPPVRQVTELSSCSHRYLRRECRWGTRSQPREISGFTSPKGMRFHRGDGKVIGKNAGGKPLGMGALLTTNPLTIHLI